MKKLESVNRNGLDSFEGLDVNELGLISGGAAQHTGSDSNGASEWITEDGCVVVIAGSVGKSYEIC